MKGKLIIFEGIDGCGKTVQLNLLKDFLETEGYRVRITEEPSHTILGDLVKAAAKIDGRFCPATDGLLFAADTLEHTKRVIEPALELGDIILCERYALSSYTYQYVEGLPMEWIKTINKFALEPDLTIVLDIPARVSRKRRSETLSFEESMMWKFEKADFLEKVREKYSELAKSDSKIILIDGTKPVDEIQEEIRKVVRERLNL